MSGYQNRTPQEGVQQVMKQAEEQALENDGPNDGAQQSNLSVPSNSQIDFLSSAEYNNQLTTYVQEIGSCNFQQLEFKLKTLYVSLISQSFSRSTTLQHLRNVLQSLDKIAQQLSNDERQKEIRMLWNQVQAINVQNPQIVELWDASPLEDEEGSMIIKGVFIKSIPFSLPDNVITYIVLPVRARLLIDTKLRGGDNIPTEIYIKRHKGRPSKNADVYDYHHDYYTPVFLNGEVDSEIIDFFSQDSQQLATEIEQLAKQIYDQRDYYMNPENRQAQIQQINANIMYTYDTEMGESGEFYEEEFIEDEELPEFSDH